MRGTTPAVANALIEWDSGERRLEERVPSRDARLRVVNAVDDELRRRVGSTYSLADLVSAYADSSGWFLEVAERTVPGIPDAWDPGATLDAVFARWARNAKDAVAR
jgi:hypothetical protein